MVSQRQQQRVRSYIALGQQEGAQLVTGGEDRPDGLDKGWYVRPTVFANVDNQMRIAQEEIFGPVLSVIAYDDVPDAVRIANESDYGLAGTVWTADVDAGLEVARVCAPAPSGSTLTPWILPRLLAASSNLVWVGSLAPKGWLHLRN